MTGGHPKQAGQSGRSAGHTAHAARAQLCMHPASMPAISVRALYLCLLPMLQTNLHAASRAVPRSLHPRQLQATLRSSLLLSSLLLLCLLRLPVCKPLLHRRQPLRLGRSICSLLRLLLLPVVCGWRCGGLLLWVYERYSAVAAGRDEGAYATLHCLWMRSQPGATNLTPFPACRTLNAAAHPPCLLRPRCQAVTRRCARCRRRCLLLAAHDACTGAALWEFVHCIRDGQYPASCT